MTEIGSLRQLVNLKEGFSAIAISQIDGKIVAGDSGGNLYILDPQQPAEKCMQKLDSSCKGAITQIVFSDVGYFVCLSADYQISLYSYTTKAEADGNVSISVKFDSLLAKTTATPTCCSVFGNKVAIASLEDHIRIIEMNETKQPANQTLLENAHEGGAISVAFDNSGTYLITMGYDKKIKVWNLTTKKAISTITNAYDKDVARMWLTAFSSNSSTYSIDSFLPIKGSVSPVAKDGICFPRTVDEESELLCISMDEKANIKAESIPLSADLPYTAIHSPNGVYFAVADKGGIRILKETQTEDKESSYETIADMEAHGLITGICWSAKENSLVVADMSGLIQIWSEFIEKGEPSSYLFQDNPKFALDGLDMEDIDGSVVEQPTSERSPRERRSPRLSKKNLPPSPLMSQSPKTTSTQSPLPSPNVKSAKLAPPKQAQQALVAPGDAKSFQQGQTPMNTSSKQYLSYNQHGMIMQTKQGAHYHVEVDYHDKKVYPNNDKIITPVMVDVAAVGSSGYCFGQQAAHEQQAFIKYKPFKELAGTEWQFSLNKSEHIDGIVISSNNLVVATSYMATSLLKVFSKGGRLLCTIEIEEPVTTMASFDNNVAVVYRNESGKYEFKILDVAAEEIVNSGAVLLTRGAELLWAGFTTSGYLATQDSKNVIRVLQRYNSWSSVTNLDSKTGETNGSFYITSITDNCVVYYNCTKNNSSLHPPVEKTLPVDIAYFEHSNGKEEQQAQSKTLALRAKVKAAIESGSFQAKQFLKEGLEVDKELFGLFVTSLEKKDQQKAVDYAVDFHRLKTLKLAISTAATDFKVSAQTIAKLNEIEASHFDNGNAEFTQKRIPYCKYPASAQQATMPTEVKKQAEPEVKKPNVEAKPVPADPIPETVEEAVPLDKSEGEAEVVFDDVSDAPAPLPFFSPSRQKIKKRENSTPTTVPTSLPFASAAPSRKPPGNLLHKLESMQQTTKPKQLPKRQILAPSTPSNPQTPKKQKPPVDNKRKRDEKENTNEQDTNIQKKQRTEATTQQAEKPQAPLPEFTRGGLGEKAQQALLQKQQMEEEAEDEEYKLPFTV